MLRTKQVTPEELIQVVERRVEAVNDTLHAVITPCFERARKRIPDLEAQIEKMENNGFISSSSYPAGFLFGLPVLIKDTNYVHGVRYTSGFYREDEDAENVRKKGYVDSDPLILQIEKMGGLVVGKTNVPEFGAGSHSFNRVFETCVNPWDTRTTASGSSGMYTNNGTYINI